MRGGVLRQRLGALGGVNVKVGVVALGKGGKQPRVVNTVGL